MARTRTRALIIAGVVILLGGGAATVAVREIGKPGINERDFWVTSYPTGSGGQMQFLTNSYGHPMDYTFPISPVQGCAIGALLNQCMQVSGWRYFIDKDASAGIVQFGCARVMNGGEWVRAFENALQTGQPGWWDQKAKHWRSENLVLIRFADRKVVLVLPWDNARKYR